MKNIFLIVSIFIWSCASTSVQTTQTFTDLDTGKETNFKVLTLTDINAFAPSTTIKFVLQCEPPEDDWIKAKCRPADVGHMDSVPGVVVGLGGSVINSAAIVGAAHLLGEGMAKSGDRNVIQQDNNDMQINQDGMNARVNDHSTTQLGGTYTK